MDHHRKKPGRPKLCRWVRHHPDVKLFKPSGIPARDLDHIELSVDEYEAFRLADHEHLYHEAAARQMNISRQTFGRIIKSARGKVADALTNGKALVIAGGEYLRVEGGE